MPSRNIFDMLVWLLVSENSLLSPEFLLYFSEFTFYLPELPFCNLKITAESWGSVNFPSTSYLTMSLPYCL